jgi:hypothetical protein
MLAFPAFLIVLISCSKAADAGAQGHTEKKAGVIEIPLTVVKSKENPSRRQLSQSLNNQGLDAYKNGRIEEAAELFRQSILADSTHLYCHYNLACMLSLLLSQGAQVDEDELYDELAIALGIDSVRPGTEKDWVVKRMGADADLDHVRSSERFIKLLESPKPVEMGNPDLLTGRWTDDNYHTLELNGDKTFSFTNTAVESPAAEVKGTWKQAGEGRYVLSGELLPYSITDRGITKSGRSGKLEFDPSRLIVRLQDEDYSTSDYVSVVTLHKATSPMDEPLADMDLVGIAGLMAQDVVPSYVKVESTFSIYPLLIAIELERTSLIRLLRGKAQFSGKWYENLGENPFVFPADVSDHRNTLYPLGYNTLYAAFIEGTYIPAIPGVSYSLVVFSLAENMVISRHGLALMEPMTSHENTKEDIFAASEGQWASIVEGFGIPITGKFPAVRSFPLKRYGSTLTCVLEKTESSEESSDMGTGYAVFIDGSKSGRYEIGNIQATDYMVLGYAGMEDPNTPDLPLFLLVFISTSHRGFEAELDKLVQYFSVAPFGR